MHIHSQHAERARETVPGPAFITPIPSSHAPGEAPAPPDPPTGRGRPPPTGVGLDHASDLDQCGTNGLAMSEGFNMSWRNCYKRESTGTHEQT